MLLVALIALLTYCKLKTIQCRQVHLIDESLGWSVGADEDHHIPGKIEHIIGGLQISFTQNNTVPECPFAYATDFVQCAVLFAVIAGFYLDQSGVNASGDYEIHLSSTCVAVVT